MYLSEDQLNQYHEDGFLILNCLFSREEVQLFQDAYDRDSAVPGEHRVVEDGGDEVRAVYASHQRQPEFATLVRSARMLGPVRQLLAEDVYIYQFKINAKPAFGGDKWSWHQDYVAWRLADNLPAPRQVNVALFLDDVTEFNGPVIFVPGSHRSGLVRDDRRAEARSAQHLDPDDIALAPDRVASLANAHGLRSPKAPAGSVVLFHPEIVHGSAANMSPFQRRLLIATYNDVANQPRPLGEPRPDYLVCRDARPLRIADTPLIPSAGGVRE